MLAAIRPEFQARLAMLAKVREQRRKVRERELTKRLEALRRAEDALNQQRQLLKKAETTFAESFSKVEKAHLEGEGAFNGQLMGQYYAWIASKRAAVATEQAATNASSAAVDMVRREETKARDALRRASVAEHKVGVALDQAKLENMRRDDAMVDALADELRPPKRGVHG